MQFNVEWLKKWVAVDLDAVELARKLTASGLEVESVKPVASEFSDVVVAEIENCQPHPDADKLVLCSVNDGSSGDDSSGTVPQNLCRSCVAHPMPVRGYVFPWPGLVLPSARISKSSGQNYVAWSHLACSARPGNWAFPTIIPA